MIITFSSWKGGTGKTTLCVLIAFYLAMIRLKKVLIVDLDSNCAISRVYGQELKDFTSMDLLSGTGFQDEKTFRGIYRAKENIDIIPSHLNNMLLNNIMDRQLKNSLRKADLSKSYDYIIIDPPGYWGAHTRNAVFASDILVIPGTCSRIDFEASRLYCETLDDNFDADDSGAPRRYICVNAYNEKMNLPGIYEEYKKEFGDRLLPEPIPYIKSLKRLTSDPDYTLQSAIKKRLENFVDSIIQEETNA
jgi:cellulose biosynthesis protein BcsQ